MIVVVATVELRPGARERFLAELAALAPVVLRETGCIEYWPTVDVASGLGAQVPLRSDVVTIVEKWESLPALAAHAVAPHMQAYRLRVVDLVAKTALQVLAPQ
ncbi:MAG: antibiotic biosynthesis monooxygenase [Gammaproteobacteria bacterium]|nr:antibiotic biosynthesis monooxygenase [Gammaproteobacteria bacterium]